MSAPEPEPGWESVGGEEPRGGELAATGTIFVSVAAASTYAAFRRLLPEWARRELTELLVGARRVGEDSAGAAGAGPERWRARSRPLGVDVTARVVREGSLAVVVHVSVRAYGPRRR